MYAVYMEDLVQYLRTILLRYMYRHRSIYVLDPDRRLTALVKPHKVQFEAVQ